MTADGFKDLLIIEAAKIGFLSIEDILRVYRTGSEIRQVYEFEGVAYYSDGSAKTLKNHTHKQKGE